MANKEVSKVVLSNGTTLIDLTSDTVTPSDLLLGATAHDMSGVTITGTCTFDSDTSEDTAVVSEVLQGKSFHARGASLIGTMTNNGSVSGEIATKTGEYVIPQGYHDGSGKVGISAVEKQKIIPSNIKAGVVLLGVTGEYSGESITAQSKTVTPSWSNQVIQPDNGYDYLSSVTVAGIPISYLDNSAGGQTVTIG